MGSILDDKGHNQGFKLVPSTVIRMKRRASFFLAEIDTEKPAKVLEIGCGTGEISFWLAENNNQLNVLGTDICKPFIDAAKSKYKLSNLAFDIYDLNDKNYLNGQKFDYIIGNGILHHLYADLDVVLNILKLRLNENGKIIFMEPNIYNPYCFAIFKIPLLRKLANLEPQEMAFSKYFIKNKLEKAEFSNIKISYKDFLIPGIPLFLVKPVIFLGDILEKILFTKIFTQSIFLTANK